MVFAALSFAAGIVLVKVTLQSAWRPASWLLLSTAALFVISGYWLRKRSLLSFLIALFSFAVLGSLDYELYLTRPATQIPLDIFNTQGEISGTVMNSNLATVRSYQSRDPESNESRQVLDIQSGEIRTGDRSYTTPLGVRLTVYAALDETEEDVGNNQSSLPEFHYDQRLRFKARLRQPHGFNNPGAWDYRGYLAGQ